MSLTKFEREQGYRELPRPPVWAEPILRRIAGGYLLLTLALGKPIDTEHDLDALIDEWEEAHATSRQAPNPGRRDPRTADADEALRADPPGIPRRAVRHTGRRDAA